MSEDSLLRQTLQGGSGSGCRLCVGPDSECVPIFTTTAADKEPLASKILACVSIKVHPSDRLSSRICHACISYLNSWQSFKNRCFSAQKKQRNHLTQQESKERSLLIQPISATKINVQNVMNQQQILDHAAAAAQQQQRLRAAMKQQQQFEQQQQVLQSQRILKNALISGIKPKMPELPAGSSANAFDHFNSAIDVSFIKDEPIDPDTEMQMVPEQTNEEDDEDIMDPMQFLANETGDEFGDQDGPPILTSLGLTHINHNSEYGPDTSANEGEPDESSTMPPPFGHYRPLPPHCVVCQMKFSNRANARRHERNIHGRVIDQSATAAAVLQLSRNHQISITAPIRQSTTSSSSTTTTSPSATFRLASQPQSVLQRKQKLAAATKTVFDYANPQQYRHLITESKLYFIKRHIEFLEQYQHMRCTCCDKDYPTYKLFMAHMRKKYDTLSRNLCFKCLKQFDTKSLFIAHLKKKNCINLYKLYCADETISKEPLPANFRSTPKDIIANKVYGCKLCEKTFRLKVDFRGHVNIDHMDEQRREQAGNGCAYCDIVFEDSSARKRHFNNLECIVFLICGTCEDKFDTLALYIEHVYATHLPQTTAGGVAVVSADGETTVDPVAASTKEDEVTDECAGSANVDTNSSSSSASVLRHLQNCNVCGKQYNNYYNMLRHMEAKHPDSLPRIYRCNECNTGFPRQSELRDHLYREHDITLPKFNVRRGTFTCRPCGNTFDDKDALMEHQATSHSKYFCHLCDTETDERDEMDAHLAEHAIVRGNQCTICEHSFNSERGLETHLAVVHGIKKAQMPRRHVSLGGGVEDDRPKQHTQSNGDSAAADEEDENAHAEEHEEDNDGDLDETVEQPVKRMKYDLSAASGSGADQSPMALRKCKLCHESFFGGISLANHMRTHGIMSAGTPRPPLQKAPVFMARLNSRIIPSATIKTKVISRMRCRICQKRIHTKTSYKRHMLNIHGVRDCVFIKCTMCPAEFSNDKGLKVHMFRTHNISVQQMQQDVRLRPVPQKESTAAAETAAAARMFECNICHTVYRSREQMYAHKATVHGSVVDLAAAALGVTEVKQEPASNDEADEELPTVLPEVFDAIDPNQMWWQCRYCDATFNASKKLTIHMNSHEEHDTTDNSCVDCGNVYRTRKSLWVHRHKKHPRIPNPSPCELCLKVFFDKTELLHHLRTHPNADVFTHLTDMQASLTEDQLLAESGRNQREELSCHICGQRFFDKRVLSKHLRTHEPADDSDLIGLLDTVLAKQTNTTISAASAFAREYSFPSYQGQMVDGEYACDMCPKTFPLINALKVHRGWHYRSPDGRQVTDTNNMWQPGQGRGSAAAAAAAANMTPFKRLRTGGRIPKCPYCRSTFASGNNLRRHIVEVHKRNEAKEIRENGSYSDAVSVDRELECGQCDIMFSNRAEWVEHKISHARTMKPSTTFEWGCEICGKIFTRKERLLAHMGTHLTGKRGSTGQNSDAGGGDVGDSKSSMSSVSQPGGVGRQQPVALPREHPGTADSEDVMYGDEYADEGGTNANDEEEEYDEEEREQPMDEGVEEEEEDEEEDEEQGDDEQGDEEDEEEGGDEEMEVNHASQPASSGDEEEQEDEGEEDDNNEDEEDEQQSHRQANDSEQEAESDDRDDPNNENRDDDYGESSGPSERPARAYSCDLCQVFFNTAKDLRRHVTSHFINGPPISTSPAVAKPDSPEPLPPTSNTIKPPLDGFRCRLCGSSSKLHMDMIKCMDNHKVVTSLRCADCRLYFADAQQVLDHEKLCHPNKFAT